MALEYARKSKCVCEWKLINHIICITNRFLYPKKNKIKQTNKLVKGKVYKEMICRISTNPTKLFFFCVRGCTECFDLCSSD